MKPGWVRTGKGNNLRPFERWEEITKGKNKGLIKIWLSDKTIIVPKENIRTWPEEPKFAPQSKNSKQGEGNHV